MNYPTDRCRIGLIAILFSLLAGGCLALPAVTVQAKPSSSLSPMSSDGTEAFGQWTTHGPYGGRVLSLTTDPTNTGVIYAGTAAGVFKSANSGATWSICLSNFYASLLVIDPAAPANIYAAGYGAMKSADGGSTWNPINTGLVGQLGEPVRTLASLVIDRHNTNTLYALGVVTDNYYNVYKTTNGGGNWSVVHTWFFQTPPNGFLRVNCLTIDPVNSNVLYAGGSIGASGVVFKSTNGGGSWSQSPFLGNDSRSIIGRLAVDPVDPSIVYAATGFQGLGLGVFKSANAGQSWTLIRAADAAITTIVIDPLNPSVLYIGTYAAVSKSIDHGQTWTPLPVIPGFLYCNALAIAAGNTATVYAGTDTGVFKTNNNGANWNMTNDGLHNIELWALTVHPVSSDRLFTRTAIFDTNQPFVSADGGLTWAKTDVHPMAFDPLNVNIVYGTMAVTGDLKKSTDGGVTWVSANNGIQHNTILEVLVDPINTDIVYAGGYVGIFKSHDAGGSWSTATTQFYPLGLVMDPKNTNVLYAFTLYDDCITSTYLTFKSGDGGTTWTSGPEFSYLSSLAIDPINTTTVYLGGCRTGECGVFRSDDAGANWDLAGSPGDYEPSSLVIDPTNSNVLYAGTFGHGVFRSLDRGATWSPLSNGLTNSSINALALDSTGNFLHAATQSGEFDYQIAIPCAYSNSAASQTLAAAGGPASVNVTATTGCRWQVVNTAAWIEVNAPAGGSGDGTVGFSVSSNASPFPRTAVLNIAGHAFTINQFGAPPVNSIDGTQFFVQQHYHDFLNRQPDTAGLTFWSDSISACGFDPQCYEVKRINGSAAFFLSIEFQQTGYLVYRTFKVSYGNLPNAPVPIKFNEFLPDTQQIGQGVIVNQSGWEQLLENNKQAFFASVVQRSRFTSAYQSSLTPGQFVDQLFLNAGVRPLAADRQAAINEFGIAADTADTAARARALRRVAENSIFGQQEFNRAFVLMQYFGYLRRNANDPPEPGLNFDGYNFWLNKLNQFNGNFVNAEMVKAFLVSTEYRQRFGP